MKRLDWFSLFIAVLIFCAIGFLLHNRSSRGIDTSTSTTTESQINPIDQLENRLIACNAFPNGSTQEVVETSRMFINIPKDIYPDVNLAILTDGVTVGYVSNGGQYGYAAQGTPDCWSYYFEFGGVGTADILATSTVAGIPDYHVHFIVTKR